MNDYLVNFTPMNNKKQKYKKIALEQIKMELVEKLDKSVYKLSEQGYTHLETLVLSDFDNLELTRLVCILHMLGNSNIKKVVDYLNNPTYKIIKMSMIKFDLLYKK